MFFFSFPVDQICELTHAASDTDINKHTDTIHLMNVNNTSPSPPNLEDRDKESVRPDGQFS